MEEQHCGSCSELLAEACQQGAVLQQQLQQQHSQLGKRGHPLPASPVRLQVACLASS